MTRNVPTAANVLTRSYDKALSSPRELHEESGAACKTERDPQGNGDAADKMLNMSAQSNDPKDRRGDLRIDVAFPIIVVIPSTGERLPAVVENISLSGVLLRAEGTLPLQTRIDLEIQPRDAEGLRIPATVVRSTGVQSYGSSFVELSEPDAARLLYLAAEFLNAAAPTPWFLG